MIAPLSKIFNFELLYGLALLICLSFSCTSENEKTQPPNIVWITSEDNSKHYMKLFDANGVETPHIESLAEQGIIFSRCFSNAPVCSVARSTLISGCYAPRVGAQYHRKLQKVPMPGQLQMFPSYLREAGYYTTNNNKEDYNFLKAGNVWDESSKTASWENRAQGQPFFHVFNIGTTHESSLHFSEEDMQTKTKTDLNSFYVQPNHPDDEIFKYTNARYRDNIVKMDEQVGAVVEKLKKEGLYDNTFIFYFGDHGGVLPGSKGYLYETGLHVPLVVHVPKKYSDMIDGKIGSSSSGFVSFIDFAPTVLNLAGIPVPEEMDGIPFLGPEINSEELAKRDETYSYADRFDEKYDMVRAVRKGNYKYIRSYQPFNFDGLMNNYRYLQLAYRDWETRYQAGGLNEVQSQFFEPRPPELLFDVEADPYETKNLAKDPEYADIRREMHNKLTDWTKQMPDLSFFPEHFLMKEAFENPVKFGQDNKTKIQNYIDITDLGLTHFKEAEEAIRTSLQANDPWERYWGLVVSSSFGKKARDLIPLVKEMAHSPNEEPINKVRAAEFLAIVDTENPMGVMLDALYQTKEGAEALLILNAIVLQKDGYAKEFQFDFRKLSKEVQSNEEVGRRLSYLNTL